MCLYVSFTAEPHESVSRSGLTLQVRQRVWLPASRDMSREQWSNFVFQNYSYTPPAMCADPAPPSAYGLQVAQQQVVGGSLLNQWGHPVSSDCFQTYFQPTSRYPALSAAAAGRRWPSWFGTTAPAFKSPAADMLAAIWSGTLSLPETGRYVSLQPLHLLCMSSSAGRCVALVQDFWTFSDDSSFLWLDGSLVGATAHVCLIEKLYFL